MGLESDNNLDCIEQVSTPKGIELALQVTLPGLDLDKELAMHPGR
ncbi:MAG: hypothetical protein NTW21_28300 [Verrucomicrobia bacterium]|nr:hypothetical protein [Verrucomicrobiota bacterium]